VPVKKKGGPTDREKVVSEIGFPGNNQLRTFRLRRKATGLGQPALVRVRGDSKSPTKKPGGISRKEKLRGGPQLGMGYGREVRNETLKATPVVKNLELGAWDNLRNRRGTKNENILVG